MDFFLSHLSSTRELGVSVFDFDAAHYGHQISPDSHDRCQFFRCSGESGALAAGERTVAKFTASGLIDGCHGQDA
jgi:hypothetical protein